MALLTVEIPERLLAKLKRTGRPAQEVIVEALEKVLNGSTSAKPEELSREEIIRHLVESGTVHAPEEWDSPEVQAWLDRPESERQKIIKEMNEMYFSDSPASSFIIENRR